MSLHSANHFADAEFKSGAMMWFSSTLDTNSPWGTSFPLAVPVSSGPKREIGVVDPPKPPVKSVQQLFGTNEFVQVASNQRWNTQNLHFGSIQPEMSKKASKVVSPAPIAAEQQSFSVALPAESEPEEESTTQNLYKTEYCRSFEETGTCRYGLKCQFAHGDAELRPVTRHPKYKTEVCKTFHSIGTCPYGKRCRFIHIEAPTQQIPSSVKISPQKSVPKSAPAKPSFENINGAGWSNNWNGSFPTSTTIVNSPPAVVAAKGLPHKIPVDQFASLNISKEPTERRSRLGIFQQICS